MSKRTHLIPCHVSVHSRSSLSYFDPASGPLFFFLFSPVQSNVPTTSLIWPALTTHASLHPHPTYSSDCSWAYTHHPTGAHLVKLTPVCILKYIGLPTILGNQVLSSSQEFCRCIYYNCIWASFFRTNTLQHRLREHRRHDPMVGTPPADLTTFYRCQLTFLIWWGTTHIFSAIACTEFLLTNWRDN